LLNIFVFLQSQNWQLFVVVKIAVVVSK